MACITLTRTALPLGRGAPEVPGWTVAYEGRPVAAYAEGADGRLRQVGSSRLDASLGGREGAWSPAREFRSLDALREAYLHAAKTWEEREAGEGAPRGKTGGLI